MQINVKTKYFLTNFKKKIKPYINLVRLKKYLLSYKDLQSRLIAVRK